MKRYTLLLTLLLLISALQADQPREWYNFNEGINLASESGKPIVIDFYTNWCRWCKVMDTRTFQDPLVEQFLFENFVPIRINAEETNNELFFQGYRLNSKELTTAFGVKGFPSVAFLTEKKELITVIPGYIENKTFLQILKYIKNKCYEYNISLEEFIKNGCGEKKDNGQ